MILLLLIEQLAEARRNAHENCPLRKKKTSAMARYLLFVEKRSVVFSCSRTQRFTVKSRLVCDKWK